MSNFLIFERATNRGDPSKNVFIRLECEEPNEVFQCEPHGLEIINSFGMSSPVIRVQFKDGRGDLFNHMKVNTSAKFTLTFGRKIEESFSLDLKVSKVQYQNTALGRPHDMIFNIYFVLSNWFDVIGKRKNTGWANNKHSDIVSEIVEDCGFAMDGVTITETDAEIQSVIQPHWTNWKMLRWIRDRAVPNEGAGHFEMGVTLNGDFKFITTDDMFFEKEKDIENAEVPLLRMMAPPETTADANRMLESNKGNPTYFLGFNATEFYMDGIRGGAGGYQSQWYDWNEGEYKTENITFDQTDVIQLSEYSSVREQHSDMGKKYFGGRDNNTINQVKNYIQEEAYSMFSFDIVTSGTGFIDIFDIVELIIDNTSMGSKVPINEMYSGFYLVAGYRHIFSFDRIVDFQTTLTLTRHGIDFFDYEGFDDLISSTTGKF